MSYRSKLLIKLAQNNVQHFNNSNSATMVSDSCNNFQKESDSFTLDPTSFCVAYDDGMDLTIDPTLVPLSESWYSSFCEEIGRGQYTELLNITTSSVMEQCSQISESVSDNTNNNIESQVSHDCVQITTKDMLLPSIIHNSQPRATNDIVSDDIVSIQKIIVSLQEIVVLRVTIDLTI
ncbi:hypothetical protein HHI36_012367 [Cryptolaemus montrouzieri]|uniref:Uncharacterized protein n=1 Tax=Cryptolaemus montrouzieri TaxID=559131 RepID=A0ABD2NE14_9CUCU